ncbi:MAG: hypothetical protein CMF22_11855 [Idiomarinaceae bacterium]|nr:hypothetical protein [Idiomarinaceae bacterium]|tara:strand:+ start:33887 stop:34717 length:831 start_codon:yes stop_codon:yes gene_type:complete
MNYIIHVVYNVLLGFHAHFIRMSPTLVARRRWKDAKRARIYQKRLPFVLLILASLFGSVMAITHGINAGILMESDDRPLGVAVVGLSLASLGIIFMGLVLMRTLMEYTSLSRLEVIAYRLYLTRDSKKFEVTHLETTDIRVGDKPVHLISSATIECGSLQLSFNCDIERLVATQIEDYGAVTTAKVQMVARNPKTNIINDHQFHGVVHVGGLRFELPDEDVVKSSVLADISTRTAFDAADLRTASIWGSSAAPSVELIHALITGMVSQERIAIEKI